MVWLLGILLFIYTIACLFLIFVILIQSGKGGGLSSLASASQGLSDSLGTTGAERTLNRMTTWAASGFMVLAILISLIGGTTISESRSIIGETPGGVAQPVTGIPGTEAPSAPGPVAGPQAVPAPPAEAEVVPSGLPGEMLPSSVERTGEAPGLAPAPAPAAGEPADAANNGPASGGAEPAAGEAEAAQ
ncbi:MAG TPA: preprotein translocase subunit SecG [Candidatus Sumerlaeota bacterium]|nr:MAG: preprotein translocase subunit SecG [candidate division BRC1 bacterium ADurb.BinA292]HOE95310.1 preprotein translocase subunit SecG [Candidatus Sumerlaeota bacterium]HOR29344.1 preprotein translocase subunit SecG [Candidatus Sumerlaeota bacterium]